MTERCAVVTGASSGIGKAIYEGLKESASTLGLNSVIGVSRRGPDIKAQLPRDTNDVLDNLKSRCADVRLLVNCAGIMVLGEETYAAPGYIFEVNFWAPYLLTVGLADRLRSGGGCVINIASVSGLVGDPGLPIYAASKAALISLTKSLALKYAPDIRVNAISPGFFRTNLVEGETPKELINQVPMRYEAEPKQLVGTVITMFLNDYMTGANVVVDGGLSCKAS